jgi:predicted oxidoreductase
MKKKKLKALVKSAKKTIREDIKTDLITRLQEITGKYGQDSKKLNKDIQKGASQLARKLAKDIKVDKVAEVHELIDQPVAAEETPVN